MPPQDAVQNSTAPLPTSHRASDPRARSAAAPDRLGPPDIGIGRPSRWGWAVILLGFGAFLAWASFAPLDQGVSAAGQVVVADNRKAVQSLVAGRIESIGVRDGDAVHAGQILIELESVHARSQLEIARGQWFTSLATDARLAAEQDARSSIAYSPQLVAAADDPRAANAMRLQSQLFQARRAALAGDLAVLGETIKGLEGQASALEGSRSSRLEQRDSLTEQLARLRELSGQGYYPANRVAEQEREHAQVRGALAEEAGTIVRVRQAAAETRARLANRHNEQQKEVYTHRTEIQRELQALESRIASLQHDVANTRIKSPANGIVVGLSVFTIGGVVPAGATLMDIVPRDEPLRIDAQLPTMLIDKIKPGLPVDIRFPALLRADTPRIPAIVKTISADALVDPASKQPYYKAQVEVTAQGMSAVRDFEIRPGMPAEVFIQTGERTLVNYILKPLRDRMRSALIEQ